MTTRIATSPVIWIGVIAGVVTGAATLLGGGGPGPAALSGVIPVAYAVLVTLLARRSAISSLLAGRPIDERWEHIGLEATALTVGISAVVIIGAFAFAIATNGDWQPYAFVGAAMAVAYAASLLFIRLRH
jgi:NO-binding membrane sensor protein with MHYT domain